MKYAHSKPAFPKAKKLKKQARRKASIHKTVENIYGSKYPGGGGSLGVTYTKLTGAISKVHRADSKE